MSENAPAEAIMAQRVLLANVDDVNFAAAARGYVDCADPPTPGRLQAPLREVLYFQAVLPEILHRLDPRRGRAENRPHGDFRTRPTAAGRALYAELRGAAAAADAARRAQALDTMNEQVERMSAAALADAARLYRPAPAHPRDGLFATLARNVIAPEAERRARRSA